MSMTKQKTMMIEFRFEQAKLRKATELGEQIAKEAGFLKPPVDPFVVIRNEQGRIKHFGDNFGSDFDGRLEFQRPSFLLFYNTKYDEWSHAGKHHPKVSFTIGHELGHYFQEHHRSYLMGGGGAHGSLTEFQSNRMVEREADSFSSGLLMPKFLLGKIVNRAAPTLDAVKQARDMFQVSLTSMLVRWVQLCDFPCAVASIRGEKVGWGYCSTGFKNVGIYQIIRGTRVSSRNAKEFISQDSSFTNFREGSGYSDISRWVGNANQKCVVTEQYLVVPSTQQMLVFLTAEEEDIANDRDW
ncbi:ImmA/IrrE family metallo-endopeptidase [Roseimaritima ulvae]|uniref:Uncharacterized protein n=2 Tax=Roseimaritima ulvae TaxID=980254 RepID=A0A5B9R527_9BACT|nr:ImmA/IrrE family metallo-endopeptidase [Roseimaritima ulvae]QEG41323.1 hypothetical protein UC8_33420 [Roseimaritima ulvae]